MFALLNRVAREGCIPAKIKGSKGTISFYPVNHNFIQELELVLSQFPIIPQTSRYLPLQCTLPLINDPQVLLGKSRMKIHSTYVCRCGTFFLHGSSLPLQCRHSGSLNQLRFRNQVSGSEIPPPSLRACLLHQTRKMFVI